jgi:3-phenylpropionate/trans-cinnamate dioxygenase ferredoxin reductase subunit
MTAAAGFVIIGASLAGAKAAEALRAEGYDGALTLVGTEADLPYERPPLSKAYLNGTAERSSVFVHTPEWYADNGVELRLGVSATSLDPEGHEIALADGERLRYDKLLLATGSAPRPLTVPGAHLDGVRYLRTLDDSDRLKATFTAGSSVVIVGAGWIGLETAAAARGAGAAVTVVELAELPLLRVLGSEVAPVFASLHRDHGVDLRLGVGIDSIRPDPADPSRVGAVVLADGTDVAGDVVVVGVGVTPNVELAEAAGLWVDNGIVTDEHLKTSHPDVFAAGDVANAFHPFLGRYIRVEHWANALNQPVTAAKSMLGQDASYDRLPYFYTDQYDLGMEYTGYVDPDGFDRVVIRGDAATREFVAFWLLDGRVLAGMNVNVWDVTDPIKALILSQRQVDAKRLADANAPLEDLAN